MVDTFLSWPIIYEVILPFVLVFTLLFAILEKTKVLGSNKQNHALISLASSLLLVISTTARDIIGDLVPFFAVVAVVLMIFMLLYGFVLQEDKVDIPGPLKNVILGVVVAGVIVAILSSTGYWDKILDFVKSEKGILANIGMLVVIIAAAVVTVKYTGASKP